MARSGGRFSDEEIRQLRKLPSVANVTHDRITYSDTFRHVCVIRYLAGESPTKIFREAGLPPELIGHKRIERCVARWKAAAMKSAKASEDMDDRQVMARLVERYERALVMQQNLDRRLDRLAGSLEAQHKSNPPSPASNAAERGNAADAKTQTGENPGNPEVSDMIIEQLVRRIDELERTNAKLRDDLRGDGRYDGHGAAGVA